MSVCHILLIALTTQLEIRSNWASSIYLLFSFHFRYPALIVIGSLILVSVALCLAHNQCTRTNSLAMESLETLESVDPPQYHQQQQHHHTQQQLKSHENPEKTTHSSKRHHHHHGGRELRHQSSHASGGRHAITGQQRPPRASVDQGSTPDRHRNGRGSRNSAAALY